MFDGRDPIYVQIAESIRGEILSGALSEGDQVMSTTTYATTYRINPATAAKAFAGLVDEGILRKQRGVGMFVCEGAAEQLRAQRRDVFFIEHFDPLMHAAALLGITQDDLMTHLRKRRS